MFYLFFFIRIRIDERSFLRFFVLLLFLELIIFLHLILEFFDGKGERRRKKKEDIWDDAGTKTGRRETDKTRESMR